jgi:hypothetical protein
MSGTNNYILQLATYGSYGICVGITVILCIVARYVRGGGFVEKLVFYLLIVVCFLSGDKFALTNDGGGKKSRLFYLLIPLVIVLTIMGLAAILFGVYLTVGYVFLRLNAS